MLLAVTVGEVVGVLPFCDQFHITLQEFFRLNGQLKRHFRIVVVYGAGKHYLSEGKPY